MYTYFKLEWSLSLLSSSVQPTLTHRLFFLILIDYISLLCSLRLLAEGAACSIWAFASPIRSAVRQFQVQRIPFKPASLASLTLPFFVLPKLPFDSFSIAAVRGKWSLPAQLKRAGVALWLMDAFAAACACEAEQSCRAWLAYFSGFAFRSSSSLLMSGHTPPNTLQSWLIISANMIVQVVFRVCFVKQSMSSAWRLEVGQRGRQQHSK